MAHPKRPNPFESLVSAVGNAIGFVLLVPVMIVEAAFSG